MNIAENLRDIRARIAAARPGAAETVRLVAVSKLQPPDKIREAYGAGQRDFGENYAQELRDKAAALRDLEGIRWHFVGHLQTNKAKYVAPVVTLAHAIDSLQVAEALVQRAGGRLIEGLIEVNVGEEAQKRGVSPTQVEALARALMSTEGFTLRGLMCIPPADVPARSYFRKLRELRDQVAAALRTPLPDLSMGMSDDFEDAVSEGATLVRVGTAIFGERAAR